MTDRRALLDEYFALEPKRHEPAAIARRAELRDAYESWLPRVTLARCPFTGAAFETAFDPEGLDGLWWCYDVPVRGYDERPATFFALSGAVRLAGDVEAAPFDRLPGPEAPYVLPRMLLHDDVRAVVSAVRVGAHQGYAVTYFASPVPPMLQRCNDWGAGTYTYGTDADPDLWDESDEQAELPDFDLARWIGSGDLSWIAPDDPTATPRSTAHDCPYLDLPGDRTFRVIAGAAPRSRSRPSTARRRAAP